MHDMRIARRLGWLTVGAGLGLVVLVALLGVALRPRESPVCPEGACGAPEVELPAAIRFGALDPKVAVLLWIDLESSKSRQIFQRVTREVAASRPEEAAELRLLHLPRRACEAGERSLACFGARLVECAEAGLPGAGVRAAGALFDLQWRPSGQRTAEGAEAALAELGLDTQALVLCAAGSPAVEARLRAHAKEAAAHGLAAAPGGLVVDVGDLRRSSSFGEWLTERSLRAIVGCLIHRRCEEVV